MQQSKARTTFINRLLHFNDDIELMDILYYNIANSTMPEDGKLFRYFSRNSHPNIARHTVISQHNRMLIATHCRATLYSAYVKELYEEFTIYLRSIIAEAYSNAKVEPGKIVGDQGKINMSAREILKFSRDGTLIDIVIGRIFQALENERSTIQLVNKTCEKLELNVDDGIIQDAVLFLEIRHKLVHTDGFADEDFKTSHPDLTYTPDSYIDLTYNTIVSMREKVTALIDAIDSEAISKGILKPHTVPKK